MARYIDADKVLPKIQYREKAYGCYRKIYSKVIKDAPTADVRPERHGQWKKFSENTWQCTKCKKLFSAQWWYCPRCGAKMDGKEEDK